MKNSCVSTNDLIDSGSTGIFISPKILQKLDVRKKKSFTPSRENHWVVAEFVTSLPRPHSA